MSALEGGAVGSVVSGMDGLHVSAFDAGSFEAGAADAGAVDPGPADPGAVDVRWGVGWVVREGAG
ncbi:hypothetical protein JOF29_005511 [Kribbella aluminosa]|uniref:Uncharacterized protein n=1 Tax=Kribbella aluminosa TaxID=416017 RepID=A0ABS4US80_9ACTN|nr:hypothetical protein [Kribbella aluminosa]